jgi:queuosine precursor transporter
MNETIFFIHVILVITFLLIAFKMGKYALSSFICLQAILANLFVVKQIELFSMTVTCSDVFSISTLWGLNLLNEYYGKTLANKVVKITFFVMIFFAVMAKVHVLYLPSSYDYSNMAFLTIFASTPRIIIASFIVFFFVQKFDIKVFSFLRNKLSSKSLVIRMGISLFISQFIDTVLFSYLGLYGIVTSIFDIVVVSYTIKVVVIIMSVPFAVFARYISKNKEVEYVEG